MDICMVSRDFSYPPYGGLAAHVYELSKAIVGLGHTVHVVKVSYGTAPDSIETINGVTVHWIFVNSKLRGVRFAKLIIKVCIYINRLLKTEKIDIIHWHDFETSSIATKFVTTKQIPKIFTNHTSTYLEMIETWRGKIYLSWLLRHADYIIAPSQELAQKSLWIGRRADTVKYLPNGVDFQKFNPYINRNVIRHQFGIKPDEYLALCPRRLQPKNGVIYFVKAVPHVKAVLDSVKFLVVGGGYPEERRRIETQIAKDSTADDVILAGAVLNDEMPFFYAASDLVVLPSLMEATSIAGLEAMASGKALIGTNIGGIPAIIDDGVTGILVPPKDAKSIADSIIKLIRNQQMRKQMGTRAQERVEREFSWNIIAARTINVYESVLKPRY